MLKLVFDRLAPLQEKIQRFLDLGVKIGLLIEPDEQIVLIHRLHNEAVVLGDGDLPFNRKRAPVIAASATRRLTGDAGCSTWGDPKTSHSE